MNVVRGGAKTANNLTTTEKGYVLDARQGEILNSKIEKLSGMIPFAHGGNMPAGADFNTYRANGWYGNSGTNSGQLNAPPRTDNGVLLVFSESVKETVHTRQIWIGLFCMQLMTRTCTGEEWSGWKSFVTE